VSHVGESVCDSNVAALGIADQAVVAIPAGATAWHVRSVGARPVTY
jgi:hypothetical protein